jgi:nitrogenase molybdenum-iron protein alpha/beta subunit
LLQEFESGEVEQRIRTFSQSAPDDVFVALELLAGIRDIGIIVHGPRGCAASLLQTTFNEAGAGGRWVVTNLSQRETIMGADTKLRAVVAAFHQRHRIKAIVVVATPTVAINNDDIQSVIEELSDELGTIIVPVFTSGFTSKAGVHGHDVALHSLVKRLLRNRPESRGDGINLLSVADSEEDRAEAERLVSALGLEVQTLPRGATLESLVRAGEAKLSVPLNFDTTSYLGEAIESITGVPFLRAPRPIGLPATKRWLARIGEATGKETQAQELHALEAAALGSVLEASPLRGKRVYVSLEPATALGVLELAQELGGEIAGLSVTHLDRAHVEALREFQNNAPALSIHVGHEQGFEELNLIRRSKPDLYIGSGAQLVQVARTGIPSVHLGRIPIVGYQGVRAFARALSNALRNPAFLAGLAIGTPGAFQPNWFQRSPNWHIKMEVK